MQFDNLYGLSSLEAQFGPVVSTNGPVATTRHDLVGDFYRDVLTETTAIVAHQWRNEVRRSAIKGFFLGGPPGVGKTSLARRAAYELCLRFSAGDEPDNQVVLALIDGGEIARARYGESEERIREVFRMAQQGFTVRGQRSILLFDDVESILMARGSENAKEWHFSQDSVFFHSVDELDTSRTVVFLTSNRRDLVDEAILDRFLSYSFGYPDRDMLIEVARRRAEEQRLAPEQVERLVERVRKSVAAGELRNVREVERLVVRQYVEDLLGRPSRALIGAEPESGAVGGAGVGAP
jgi:ATP-dependent 26S proteasome regulatory subunit